MGVEVRRRELRIPTRFRDGERPAGAVRDEGFGAEVVVLGVWERGWRILR